MPGVRCEIEANRQEASIFQINNRLKKFPHHCLSNVHLETCFKSTAFIIRSIVPFRSWSVQVSHSRSQYGPIYSRFVSTAVMKPTNKKNAAAWHNKHWTMKMSLSLAELSCIESNSEALHSPATLGPTSAHTNGVRL